MSRFHPAWLLERIMFKARRKGRCLIWRGATTGHRNSAFDYGLIWHSELRKRLLVPRVVLEEKLGRALKPGMCALHHCDTPLCIERKHLFEGTRADNLADMRRKGRWRARGDGR